MIARSVPKHIDKKGRTFEYLMAFSVPFFLLRAFFPLSSIPLSLGIAVLYIKGTAGKPDGYLQQQAYRIGLPVRGLLSRRIKKLER